MDIQLGSAVIGGMAGMVSTGLVAAVTTGARLARMDTRLAAVEHTLRDISYVRVRHRRSDAPHDEGD